MKKSVPCHDGPGQRALGVDTQKKRLLSADRDEEERAAWRAENAGLDAGLIVSVDESGSNPAMCLRYGRAPKGQRAEAKVPRNRGANTTILAALTPQGLLAPMVVEGGTTIEVFLTFLEHCLCPALRPGQVLLDNLRVHKNHLVTERIEATGARVLFLPRYSPDFQPIEGVFAKLKAFLRRTAARTQQALEAAIAAGLATVTSQDACGWFTHCGYPACSHLS